MAGFRTRQAPSPTGYLHFGTARQMLFTRLFATINHGSWFLRLEDTDRARLQVGAVGSLFESLAQLGLLPDEGVTSVPNGQKDVFYGVYQKGSLGPYIQSERLELYHEHAQKMIDKNLAYWCYLTTTELEELQSIKKATHAPIQYASICAEKYTPAELSASVSIGLADPRKPTLRYRLTRSQTITVVDQLLGSSEFNLALEEDFVILKSDGYPTYHLAHVVDDHLMKTSLVIRAQEWYPSMAKHVTMFGEYWGAVPDYIHLPFILGETGTKKMSKRDGNVNMQQFLDAGFLPEAILNYLAFLGWNPGTEQELYLEEKDFVELTQAKRLEKLIKNIAAEFSLDKLSTSPARFSTEKLTWYNRECLKMMTVAEFAEASLRLRALSQDAAPRVYLISPDYLFAFVEVKKTDGGDKYTVLGCTPDAFDDAAFRIATNNQGSFEQNHLIRYEELAVYTIAKDVLLPYFLPKAAEVDQYRVFEWVPLGTVLQQNPEQYVRFNMMAHSLGLPVVTPTVPCAQAYTAWILDKERAATLSDFGSDSASVIAWQQPSIRDVTWKKSTATESKEQLSVILNEVLIPFYDAPEAVSVLSLQTELLTASLSRSTATSLVKAQLVQVSMIWEQVLKDWIHLTGRDTGSCLWPLRVALSGMRQSPSPFELLAILDRDEVVRRIQAILTYEQEA
jgi:nondiscriminating glutamyl-tRNA synthetase